MKVVPATTRELIQQLTGRLEPASLVNPQIATVALERAAEFWGELYSPAGNLWDVRDKHGNLLLGKFTFSTAAGLLPGTTLEQHGALEHHARNILGALDDQYVVDRLDQVLVGRPVSLMGYISGGSSQRGQIAIQLDPDLMYQAEAASDRVYDAVTRCARALLRSGVSPFKPVAFHAEINNRYGFSQARKEEYDLLKLVGVPEAELPLYRAHIYLTMPQVLPLNEDLLVEDKTMLRHNLSYWARG